MYLGYLIKMAQPNLIGADMCPPSNKSVVKHIPGLLHIESNFVIKKG
jgi:hypothetical protein